MKPEKKIFRNEKQLVILKAFVHTRPRKHLGAQGASRTLQWRANERNGERCSHGGGCGLASKKKVVPLKIMHNIIVPEYGASDKA